MRNNPNIEISPTTMMELNITTGTVTSPSPTLDAAEQIVTDYIQPAICVFGILCNILNLVILTRPRLKESPYTYLLGLAVADFGVLVMVFVRTVLSRRIGQGIYGWQIYNAYIFLPFANVFSNSSVWITVFLTIERWISVSFPLKAKKICTKSLARRVIVGIFMAAGAINVPRFFCRKINRIVESDGDVMYAVSSSEFEQSEVYKTITWMYIVFIHGIPCLTLIVLNTCLLHVVYKANRTRAALNGSNENNIALHIFREQRRLTVTCVSIICLFLVCVSPSAFSNRPVAYALFGQGKTPDEFFQQSFYRLLRIVTNALVTCNLSLNFILYCFFNHKFFKTLNHLFKVVMYRAFKVNIPEGSFKKNSSSNSFSSGQADMLMIGLTVRGRKCACKHCLSMNSGTEAMFCKRVGSRLASTPSSTSCTMMSSACSLRPNSSTKSLLLYATNNNPNVTSNDRRSFSGGEVTCNPDDFV